MNERDLIEKKLIKSIEELNEKISKFSDGPNEAIASLQTILWAINWFCMKQEVDKADEESIENCDNCWKALKGIGIENLVEKLKMEENCEAKVLLLTSLALVDDGQEEKWLDELENLRLQELCTERELKKYKAIVKPFFGDEFWLKNEEDNKNASN